MIRRAKFPVGLKKHHQGATDAHGNPADVWADPVSHLVYAFDPGGSVEILTDGDRTITKPAIYAQHDFPANEFDRVIVSGVEYEVDGKTAAWESAYSAGRPGRVVHLKVVEG